MQAINGDLAQTMADMDRALHRDINPDMHLRRLTVYGQEAAMYYAEGLVSADMMQHYVVAPLMALRDAPLPQACAQALCGAVCACDVARAEDIPTAVTQVMNGRAVVVMAGMRGAVGFDVRMSVRRGIAPPLTERVVLGPHQAFNESIRDCITLLRRILPTPDLIGEMRSVGTRCPTALCVLYLQGVADDVTLARVRARLEGIDAAQVLSIGALAQLIEDRPFALVPQFVRTERPDRAASMLLEGQIVLLMEGSCQALVLPATLLHLLHTPEDTSARWQYGTYLRLLRIGGMLLSLLLPGLFVALTTFHPQALPVAMMTAVLESQAGAPLSIPAEALLMLGMLGLIGEAATRVPSTVGATLGTVSGLILGSAAVEAGLTHPLMLIVAAVASLGSYAAPDYALGMAIRIGQLLLTGVAGVFGVYGVVLCVVAGAVRLCSLTSLGTPFMAPVAPQRRHNPDLLTRMPLWHQRLRTWLSGVHADAQGPMRRWDRRRT